ncbi:MAG TPA: Hsp20/alpha crystallin family protein [Thermoleophilia bacterium]|nr:Hsp20/alpha crystallin family protein [Thermoleophilia bacterium]
MATSKRREEGIRHLQSEMDRMLLELTGAHRVYGCATCAFRPNADVYFAKSDNAIVVKLELAGVDPREVQLEAKDRTIRIWGMREERTRSDKVYQQMEIAYGAFQRELRVPVDVNLDQAKAGYEAGFLIITLPVVEREARKIPIVQKTGADQPAAERAQEDGREATELPDEVDDDR